jgi:hypothetical protein
MVEALAGALGASMPVRPSTSIRAAGTSDATWIAGSGATPTPSRRTPPPLTPPSNVTRPAPMPNLTQPAPRTAVTTRRPAAPSGPSTGTVVAAVVVVAVVFLGVAGGVGWMLLGRRALGPAPADVVAPTSPLPTPSPAEETLPAAEPTPPPTETAEPARITVEELGVPTVPPPTPARPAPTRAAPAELPVSPTAAPAVPTPVPVAPTEPARPAEPAPATSKLERIVPFRTGGAIPLGIEDRFVTIDTVEVSSWPKPDEVQKASGKPGEETKLTLKFRYMNRDDDDWKCVYRVQVLDEAGKEIGLGVQERTLNGTEANDTNRVVVKMRTVDFPRAARLRVKIVANPD